MGTGNKPDAQRMNLGMGYMLFGWRCGCASLVFPFLMETTQLFSFGIGQDATPTFTGDGQVKMLLHMLVNGKANRNREEASMG